MFNWIRKILHRNSDKTILISSELGDGERFEEVDADDFGRLKEIIERLNPRKSIEGDKFVWCLIGNIIDGHYIGTDKEIKHGTKHFSPGTKIYCLPAQWGDGYEKIKVIGRHRKNKRFVCMIIPSKCVTRLFDICNVEAPIKRICNPLFV